MNYKKLFSAVLAGLMLAGSAISVSAAAKVYTAEDFCTGPFHCECGIPHYGNQCGNIVRPGKPLFPNQNKHEEDCKCAVCNPIVRPIVPGNNFWINGMYYPTDKYYVKYSEANTYLITPLETKLSNISDFAAAWTPGSTGAAIGENGTVQTKKPGLIGSISQQITICGGKYYPSNKVNLTTFFAENTYGMQMYEGYMQTFGTDLKMISSDSSVVKVITDSNGQNLVAYSTGTAYIYVYSNGGVPLMRLNVEVMGTSYNMEKAYVDVRPASWRLDGDGDSTALVVRGDKPYDDVTLTVRDGDGYIKDGKLYADCDSGVIIVEAASKSNKAAYGYAIIYVGKYVNALYNGYWSSCGNNIYANYCNPNLWGCDGYNINGWIVTDSGVYIPVIKKIDVSTTNPDGTTSTSQIYAFLYETLTNKCYGNFDTLYNWLCWNYSVSKPTQTFNEMYQEALDQLLENIAASYYAQLQ